MCNVLQRLRFISIKIAVFRYMMSHVLLKYESLKRLSNQQSANAGRAALKDLYKKVS